METHLILFFFILFQIGLSSFILFFLIIQTAQNWFFFFDNCFTCSIEKVKIKL